MRPGKTLHKKKCYAHTDFKQLEGTLDIALLTRNTVINKN